VERWAGIRWSIQRAPRASEATQLRGVWCASATACVAVGDSSAPSTRGATSSVVERWNGLKWSIQRTPTVASSVDTSLSSVSCISATACVAVGYFDFGAGCDSDLVTPCNLVSLVERWNGNKWSVQRPLRTRGATRTELSGVSCTSNTFCAAVGGFATTAIHSANSALAEVWNGATWTIHRAPKPRGARVATLNGVSCTSSTACAAVGSFTNSAGQQGTFVERWSGTMWSIQSTSKPRGATGVVLQGVSCRSSTACTAVGSFTTPGSGIGMPLAESTIGPHRGLG